MAASSDAVQHSHLGKVAKPLPIPHPGFRDLPDHVSMQLEFVGRLYERAARGDADGLAMADEFNAEFIHAWGESFERACADASAAFPAACVYRELARLLREAVSDPDREQPQG
jgi:TorA maturation chaperone TorD